MLGELPRERVAFLPTPLYRMRGLERALFTNNLWIKRDDLTGISFGGNKTRKLEFIVGDAKTEGANTLVTVGSVQSNHCRQTAAVAARSGMRCILLLGGEEPVPPTGNFLLSKLMGAEVKFFPDDDLFSLNNRMAIIIDTLIDLGLNPYAIPAGAAMPAGVIAYAHAMEEFKQQCDELSIEPTRVILATGTGSTQAGMIIGANLLDWDIDIVGITVVDDALSTERRIDELINRTVERYAFLEEFKPEIHVDESCLTGGYGQVDDAVFGAIHTFGRSEGIVLDPVYTGKAGLALMKMITNKEIAGDETTVFWHTGGQPIVFAHASELFEGSYYS